MNSIKCVKCGSLCDKDREPNFCPHCGTSLYNYCPTCNPNGITDYEDDNQICPPDEEFCSLCGSKTIFYDILIEKKN